MYSPDRLSIVVNTDLFKEDDRDLESAIVTAIKGDKTAIIELFEIPYHAQVTNFPCEIDYTITLYTE
jgi:hypothetical protein